MTLTDGVVRAFVQPFAKVLLVGIVVARARGGRVRVVRSKESAL